MNYGEKLRLVDDGFAKLCQAVMDAEPSVRTLVYTLLTPPLSPCHTSDLCSVQACTLMGNFRRVSPHFLRQTLSKEVLKGGGGGHAEDNTSVLTGTIHLLSIIF